MGKSVKYVPTIKKVFQTEGAMGFYKGWVPPFFGSVIFRSAQFSAFEAAFTHWESSESMKKEIPGTYGVQYRVVAGGMFGGTVRSCLECPFEYAKVKQ
jgi:solute carrier family 25 carnitine/acylcarnitine transporter 20/29